MTEPRFGTVTAVEPLRVRLDGEGAAVDIDPVNTAGPLVVGDRVATEVRGKALHVVGSVNAPARDLYLRNFETLLSGGGVRTATSSGVSWSKRLIGLGAGRGPMVPNGYWNIDMPASGTVIPVHGHNSQTQATVTSVVPLINWQVLWYEPPFGSGATTDSSRFHITSYITDFDVPPTWVPVVWKNGDALTPTYVFADGRETAAWSDFALSSAWVNYGAPYPNAGFRVENGLVHIRGLVKGGYITSGQTVATLPVGARPSANLMFTSQTYTSPNVTICRVDVHSSGTITFQGGQQTSWVSLQLPPFPAEQ